MPKEPKRRAQRGLQIFPHTSTYSQVSSNSNRIETVSVLRHPIWHLGVVPIASFKARQQASSRVYEIAQAPANGNQTAAGHEEMIVLPYESGTTVCLYERCMFMKSRLYHSINSTIHDFWSHSNFQSEARKIKPLV